MKKEQLKGLAAGAVAGLLLGAGLPGAYAAGDVSAVSSKARVTFYGQEITMDAPLLFVTGEDGKERLYVPAGLLEYMNFEVGIDKENNQVALTMKQQQADPAAVSKSAGGADATALDLMQRTGNWKYIEPYLPSMSREGIDAVVRVYNSKHQNPAEHKKASDYYNG